MKTFIRCGLSLLLGLVLVGCVEANIQGKSVDVAEAGLQTTSKSSDAYVRCPSERPQMCTREYRPVCADVIVNCIQAPCPNIKQTYANACEACATGNVEGYYPGRCEESNQQEAEHDKKRFNHAK